MTITIDLPDSVSEHLKSAGISVEQAGQFVVSELSRAAERADRDRSTLAIWWSQLTGQEQEHERALTAGSVAAGDAGRTRTIEEAIKSVRNRSIRPTDR